ncbi:MAG TPA: hypothetical protein VND66_11490 [Acidobacteriaceae bacterium]|nr:hypothetical protein [Terriglobia bacterium]HVC91231.1 hypothetical protein [Acidobacteriaceae bacterium]
MATPVFPLAVAVIGENIVAVEPLVLLPLMIEVEGPFPLLAELPLLPAESRESVLAPLDVLALTIGSVNPFAGLS